VIVDATHPFADKMSNQLIELSAELGLPYVRYERPGTELGSYPVQRCGDFRAALKLAATLGKRVFLATGVKDLAMLSELAQSKELANPDVLWYARVTADVDSIEKALASGIAQSRLCAMQGPFTKAVNEALWRQWQIDCLVTKDSGAAGGADEKLQAAEAMGIPVIVVERPHVDYPRVFSSQSAVLNCVGELCIGQEAAV
jgi:precorrin-3B C17-methyltransferase